jgi:hypothetical protein
MKNPEFSTEDDFEVCARSSEQHRNGVGQLHETGQREN